MKQVKADMSGSIWKITTTVGEEVVTGQEIAILESMKMEIPMESTASGKVHMIHKKEGDFVEEGDIILELE
ncbi:acetyl-CoA carboxylase biotin carboxyl carrier protein subunit [Sinobaca sp. H24]|uniref:acetyl-CoA carboxylase biotin carboxyl carrier protein subunit n=1 Tax=Sinobaca sp. H24 TaxID=2923376 RepID=UPI002079BB56|nr:acetyl-CoA carboxylase biotin carboxyl carrier protein subunit [Sinobaca sp. H24]